MVRLGPKSLLLDAAAFASEELVSLDPIALCVDPFVEALILYHFTAPSVGLHDVKSSLLYFKPQGHIPTLSRYFQCVKLIAVAMQVFRWIMSMEQLSRFDCQLATAFWNTDGTVSLSRFNIQKFIRSYQRRASIRS